MWKCHDKWPGTTETKPATVLKNDGRQHGVDAVADETTADERNGVTLDAKPSQPICQYNEQHQQEQ